MIITFCNTDSSSPSNATNLTIWILIGHSVLSDILDYTLIAGVFNVFQAKDPVGDRETEQRSSTTYIL